MRFSVPGKAVAIDHAHLPTRENGGRGQARHGRAKARVAGLRQGPQHLRLGAVDLVVERGERHGQGLAAARGRVERGAQPQHDERHQLDDGGEQQLAHVLASTMCFEHVVDPVGRKSLLQHRPRHDARRRMLLEALKDGSPAPVVARKCFCHPSRMGDVAAS